MIRPQAILGIRPNIACHSVFSFQISYATDTSGHDICICSAIAETQDSSKNVVSQEGCRNGRRTPRTGQSD